MRKHSRGPIADSRAANPYPPEGPHRGRSRSAPPEPGFITPTTPAASRPKLAFA